MSTEPTTAAGVTTGAGTVTGVPTSSDPVPPAVGATSAPVRPRVDDAVTDTELRRVEEEHTDVPVLPGPPGGLPLPRWFGPLAALAAVGLVPWIVYLAFELPEHPRVEHYDLGWVGFDVAMFTVLAGVAITALRRSVWVEPLAVAAATMLVVDAWFDVVTAPTAQDRMVAVASAVAVELPLAFICAWVARNTERLRRSVFRMLWYRLGRESR